MDPDAALSWLALDLVILAAVAAAGVVLLAVADRVYVHLLAGVHRWWLFFTGLVGVPIHEMTHAVTALFFGIRVQSVRLFTPFAQTGRLGEVGLAWNPASPWHRAGMFFVGLSPLVVGSIVVLFIMRWASDGQLPTLVPTALHDVGAWWEQAMAWLSSLSDIAVSWPTGWWTPLALFAAFSIAVHALPSGADLKGAGKGVLLIFVLGGGLAWGLSALPLDVSLEVVEWLVWGLRWWVTGIVQMTLLALAGLVLAAFLRLVFLPMTLGRGGP